MGRPAGGSRRGRSAGSGQGSDGEQAVTPVIGTILVLGITVVGIAAIMLWGAPAIQRIQAQNAQLAMIGEFEDLRASAQELSVPDHSRFPTITMPSGALSLQPGTRFLVTANQDSLDTCDFRVTDWSDASPDSDVTVDTPGACSVTVNQSNLVVCEIFGSNPVERTVNAPTGSSYPVAGPAGVTIDFTEGEWAFFLGADSCSDTEDAVAQAWLISTDQVAWDAQGGGDRAAYFDGGAVFSETDGTFFVEKGAAIADGSLGPDYVGFWLRSLNAGDDYRAISGQGSHEMYFALTSNNLRIDEDGVNIVRYDFEGELAEAWCNALLGRNDDIAAPATYTDLDCSDGDDDGITAVSYSTGTPFEFRFLEAIIHASLAL